MTPFGLIIPCYNFEHGLSKLFAQLEDWHAAEGRNAIVCFVDDGSTDKTQVHLESFVGERRSWCELISHPRNQGKGAAVRDGFETLQDRCEFILFTDCDLQYGLSIIGDAILPKLAHHDLIILDRWWGHLYRHMSFWRRWASALFNRLVAILTGVPMKDTQAGLKGFRTSSGRELFRLSRLNGFAFDVEILSIALYYRLRLFQLPVRFVGRPAVPPGSSVSLWRTTPTMLVDLIKINVGWKLGWYKSALFERQVDERGYSIR